MSFRREKCEIERRGIWLVNRFWDYVNSGAKGVDRGQPGPGPRCGMGEVESKRSRLQGDCRCGMGEGHLNAHLRRGVSVSEPVVSGGGSRGGRWIRLRL